MYHNKLHVLIEGNEYVKLVFALIAMPVDQLLSQSAS